MASENFSVGETFPISRRQFLTAGLAGLLSSCADKTKPIHLPSQPDKKVTTAPVSFNALLENEPLVGREFTVSVYINDSIKEVCVKMLDTCTWCIDGNIFTVSKISANEKSIQPDDPIPAIGTTMKESIYGCTVSAKNEGININTSLGQAYIDINQLLFIVQTLLYEQQTLAQTIYIQINVDIKPNKKSQLLLNTRNSITALLSTMGHVTEVIEVPNTVTICFNKSS